MEAVVVAARLCCRAAPTLELEKAPPPLPRGPHPSQGLALDVANKSRTTPSRCCCPCCAGRPNPWAEVYGPSRAPPAKSLLEIADEGLTTTLNFAERVIPKVSLSYELEPDSGAIVQKGLHKVWS